MAFPYTGQFGRVYKAWLHTGSGATTEVAVKTIRKYDPREMKNFMREMAVMSQLMHPNVIHLHGVVKESMNNVIVTLRCHKEFFAFGCRKLDCVAVLSKQRPEELPDGTYTIQTLQLYNFLV